MARNNEVADLPLDVIGNFPIEWERSTLGKACALVTDGTHDSPKESTTGFPLVTGKCITGGRVNLKAAYLISEQDHLAVVARSRPEVGDILFANIGNSIGELARVATSEEFSIKNVALFKPSKKLDGGYLKYYLLSPAVQRYIRGTTIGSAQPFIGLGTLRGFPIPLPKPDEQRAIAHILGTLDDKIELNRRTNETLEAIARAIFKSWFVDFDPVRAKASGEPPESICRRLRLTPDLLALFPDRLVDSELGEIPEGWGVGAFHDCCDRIESGGTPSRSVAEYWNGTIPWLTSGEVRDVIVLDTKEKITDAGLNASSAKVWPKGATVVAMYGATAGQICLLAEEMTANQACCALIPKPEFASYLFLAARGSIAQLSDKASGSAQQNLNKSLVANHQLIIPELRAANAFEKLVSCLIEKWISNQREGVTLATLRDTLLPKLISGELPAPVAGAA